MLKTRIGHAQARRMMIHDNWPMPKFDAGDPKHAHAVGVIAGTFVQFERSIESMFLHHPAQDSAMPFHVRERDFLALSEGKRVAAHANFIPIVNGTSR